MVEGAEGWSLLFAGPFITGGGGVYTNPGARTQEEQVVPDSGWEAIGTHSSGTISRRGPAL